MSWATAGSAIFQQAMLNPIARAVNAGTAPTGFTSLTADTVKVALFNNTTAPDKTVAVGLSGYNAASSQWVTANEVTDATNWVAGGRAAASLSWALDTGSSSIVYHAANTAGGGNVTITNAFGCLVYDSTITGGTVNAQGICFNYFGGSQSVTAGTFTIVWATVGATTGIFNITV